MKGIIKGFEYSISGYPDMIHIIHYFLGENHAGFFYSNDAAEGNITSRFQHPY